MGGRGKFKKESVMISFFNADNVRREAMRIFVSHPYADNPEGNVRTATTICQTLVKAGAYANFAITSI